MNSSEYICKANIVYSGSTSGLEKIFLIACGKCGINSDGKDSVNGAIKEVVNLKLVNCKNLRRKYGPA
ncbi:MAG TPA: hypothetical protein VLF93_06245 [Candidatus Saccharimonadales bacterium]|nr:hypothetical protein [Candidatus Saccharimonadales bacterium]